MEDDQTTKQQHLVPEAIKAIRAVRKQKEPDQRRTLPTTACNRKPASATKAS